MTCPDLKKDSNLTGLRIAEELCLRQLPNEVTPGPGTPAVWRPFEPNSYSDFGGNVSTIARNPINPNRQRRRGRVTDIEASAGFNQDLTQDGLTWLMQGVLFADARERPTTHSLRYPDPVTLNSVQSDTDEFVINTAAAGFAAAQFAAGTLVLASGFNTPANNGVFSVLSFNIDGSTASIGVNGALVNEGATSSARLDTVGKLFAAGDLSVSVVGGLVRLTSAAVNMTTLGLIPGEWIFVGGDAAGEQFANNAPGFARVNRVTANYIELDKVDWTPQADAGAGKTIPLFFGTIIQNENDPDLIKRRSYQLERTLGTDDDGEMTEYVMGAVPNEFTLNVAQAEKVTFDVTFLACDAVQRTGADGPKPGTRPALVDSDAYNTSSDFNRIKLAVVSNDAAVTPLFSYVTDLSLTVKNNLSALKAVGKLGPFELSTGTLEVGGSQTAYFSDVAAVQAVRNNTDVTLDLIMVRRNKGLLFDLPLVTLGNGRLAVEQDQPITIPLDNMAAQSKFGTSLMFQSFNYLPDIAGE